MPPLVPATDGTAAWPQYFVLCDYGPTLGRSWYEMDPTKAASKETVLQWLLEGQFSEPVQVLEVNFPAGTCRDVSGHFAEALRFKSQDRDGDIAPETKRFVENAA